MMMMMTLFNKNNPKMAAPLQSEMQILSWYENLDQNNKNFVLESNDFKQL